MINYPLVAMPGILTPVFPRGRTGAWARLPAVLFSVIALVHLSLLMISPPAAEITQWMLMPPLIGYLIANCRSVKNRLVRLQLAALTLSWLGDSLPFLLPKQWDFVLKLSLFCITMVCLMVAYLPYRRRSILFTRPQLMIPYVIALIGLTGICIPGAGMLWPLLVIYGVALTLMACLATGLNARTTWGGILFVVADGVLACGLFVPGFHLLLKDLWIMVPYLLAQALLTTGVVEATHSRATMQPVAVPATR